MTTRRRLLRTAAHAAIVAALVALGLYAYLVLVRDAAPLHADEAGHALPAARMALALRAGDLGAFAAASLDELVWPFLHPWLIAAFFLPFGISTEVARTSSLVTFGAVLLLLPAFARAILPRETSADGAPPLALGWLSAAVLLAAARWDLVCAVMGEPLGMLLTLATLLAAARAAASGSLAAHGASGLFAAAAFFTKYGYGIPLIAAVLLALAWRARESGRRPLAAFAFAALSPVAAWGAVQVVLDRRHVGELVGILTNRDEGLRGLANALFHARTLGELLGPALAIAVALLLGATALRGADARRLPALLFVAAALSLLTLHPNKQNRYLLPVLPVMLALAETEAAQRLRGRRVVPWLWPALALAVLAAGHPLERIHDTAHAKSRFAGARAIVGFAAGQAPAGRPVLFLGTTGLLPHHALTFELIERQQREPEVELLTFPGERGWDPRYREGYPSEMRPQYAERLREALASGRYGAVVTLALGATSPFRPRWLAKWDAWRQNYVRAAEAEAAAHGYRLRAERVFPGDDATVRVYVPVRP